MAGRKIPRKRILSRQNRLWDSGGEFFVEVGRIWKMLPDSAEKDDLAKAALRFENVRIEVAQEASTDRWTYERGMREDE